MKVPVLRSQSQIVDSVPYQLQIQDEGPVTN